MHPPGTPARSAPPRASRLSLLARAWSLLGLLILALWCGPVAAGSALSPAAGSAGPAAVALTASSDAHPQPVPQDLERGGDLFGKRRALRGSDWTPAPPPAELPAHHEAAPAALAFEHNVHRLPGDDAPPPRDHRRLLTERYPPQAPPLA